MVSVAVDDLAIQFAVDPTSPDPLGHSLLAHCFPAEPVNDLWRHLIRPQDAVIDVGAHLGIYSLPAAAAGAAVVAIEASPTNAGLLELAANRNSFTNLHILRGAAAAEAGTAAFIAMGPWGHIASNLELEGGKPDLEVPTVALDDVVRDHRWKHVNLIKIDVEGSEIEALAGARGLLASDDAPPLLIEANGHMLHQYGHVPGDMLAILEGYGYQCHLIDSASRGRLVPVKADDPQPECVTDYLAFKSTPDRLAPWWIDRPFERAEIVRRVAATCNDDQDVHRAYGARLLATAPAWLLESRPVETAQRSDERESPDRVSDADHVDEPAPGIDG